MTPQQARARALQLRSLQPELQSVAIDDLIAQVMATEGMGAPGAGGGGLADIFQPARVLTPSSPAPMQVARLAAPKPTADIVPGAGTDAFRRAQQVRERTDRGPTPVAEMRAGAPAPAPETAPAAPVREASPVASALAAAGTSPKAKAAYRSRFRDLLEQAEADLQQLDARRQATEAAGAPVSYDDAYNFKLKSSEVSQLKSLVAAEEGAVVDADRAALLERQNQRLGREEELIKQSRRLAPGTALMEFGSALAGAKPGESFASALARGLQAGSKSYTGARDAREAALRAIEEKRDTFDTQRMDALDSARNKAIELANAGVALTKEQAALINMKGEGALAETTRPLTERKARAEVTVAETEAKYADDLKQLAVQAARQSIDSDKALAELRRRSPTGGSSAGIPKGVATFYGTLGRQATSLRDAINDPLVGQGAKANYIMQLSVVDEKMRAIEAAVGPMLTTLGFGAPAASGAPVPRVAPNGRSYIPDPDRPGKYLEIVK